MLSSSPSHFFLFFTDSPQYQTSLNSHVSYWLRNKDVCYPFLCSLSNIMTALSRYITPILPICCCNHCEHYPVTHLYIPSSANRIQFPSFCERFLWINFSMTPPHSKLSLAQPKTPFNQSWDHWFQNRFYTLLLDNLNSILTWTLSRAICRVFFILQRSTITEFPPQSTSYQSHLHLFTQRTHMLFVFLLVPWYANLYWDCITLMPILAVGIQKSFHPFLHLFTPISTPPISIFIFINPTCNPIITPKCHPYTYFYTFFKPIFTMWYCIYSKGFFKITLQIHILPYLSLLSFDNNKTTTFRIAFVYSYLY